MNRKIKVTNLSYIAVPDICTDDRCLNDGTCKDTQTGYECNCALGFTGKTCGNGECYSVCL